MKLTTFLVLCAIIMICIVNYAQCGELNQNSIDKDRVSMNIWGCTKTVYGIVIWSFRVLKAVIFEDFEKFMELLIQAIDLVNDFDINCLSGFIL